MSMAIVYSDDTSHELSWDTHSFSQQRFYNLLCLVYGKHAADPIGTGLADLIPQSRIQWCPEEYDDAIHAWDTLLAEHRPQ